MTRLPGSELLPPHPPADALKADWRTWAAAARRTLATPERSVRVVHSLRTWAPFIEATVVLGYLAFQHEIDLAPAFEDRLDPMVVTRSLREPERRLTLHRLDPAQLEQQASGLRQPTTDCPELDPDEIDLVLLPGLAFDVRGRRLGYGMGYFDRFLPRLRSHVRRVGVTFDPLVVDELPHDAHDVNVTHLLTESGVREIAAP